MNKGADYEVILGWNNLRNTAKANMHKEDFRINPIVYATKILKLAHIRMDFAGIMQTIGIKGRYVGFTYIRPLYGFAPFWRS